MITVRLSAISTFALAALVLAATWLGVQSATPARVAPFLDRPGLAGGLHELEQSPYGDFRWTGETARICAPRAGWSARSLVELRLAGEYALSLGIGEVRLQANAGPPVPITLALKPRRYQILSGADQQTGADLCATISTAAIDDPNNNRRLGVPFYGAAFSHLPLADPVTPPPSQLLANLALAALALGVLHLLGVPPAAAQASVAAAALGPALLWRSGGGQAGPLWARWRARAPWPSA